MSNASTASKGTALITGASTGIGAVYADRFAKRGYDLILIARNGKLLNEFANSLSASTGRKVEAFPADLTNKEELRKVEQRLRTDKSITALVNNAGFGGVSTLLDSSVDDMENMIDLNITALLRLTAAVLPNFVERKGGAIINTSSIVAVNPELLNGVYSGTKAFVLNLTQSLHKEVGEKGIQLQAVLVENEVEQGDELVIALHVALRRKRLHEAGADAVDVLKRQAHQVAFSAAFHTSPHDTTHFGAVGQVTGNENKDHARSEGGKHLGEVHGDAVSDVGVISLVHTSGADARAVETGIVAGKLVNHVLEVHEVGNKKFFKLRVDQGGGPAADGKDLANGRVFECFQENTFADQAGGSGQDKLERCGFAEHG